MCKGKCLLKIKQPHFVSQELLLFNMLVQRTIICSSASECLMQTAGVYQVKIGVYCKSGGLGCSFSIKSCLSKIKKSF